MVFLIGTVRSALKSSFSRVVWRWGRIVAWLRTCFGRTLVLQDHRGLFYEIEYGEPFTELAGIPRSRREFTDDPEVLDFLERVLIPGDVVVDLGASIGSIALFAGRLVGNEGRVVAVEAEKTNFDQLSRNIVRNNLSSVESYHLAITDRGGEIAIHVFPRSHRGWNSIGRGEHGGPSPIGTETVKCTTIDDLVDRLQIRRVDLLKIDVEGAEPEAFAGASRSLSNGSIRRIIFEISLGPLRGMDHEIDDVVRPLRAAGYTIRSIETGGNLTDVNEMTISQTKYANLVALAPGADD